MIFFLKKKKRTRRSSQNKISDEKRREQEARYEGIEIDRKLYLGGRLAAQNYEWLTETFGEMGYILNVSECTNYFEEEPRFTYKRIHVSDASESNISRHFEDASNFIHQGLNNDCCVFVHCREGKSRSIAIIIAYFMIKRNWTLEKAYQHIVSILPWKENINQGFKLQLMNLDFQKQGKDEVSLDFYSRKNRRRSQPQINYCEIDPNDDEPETKKKSKDKSNSRLIQPMLSFEAYWKLMASEKNKPSEPAASETLPLTSLDPDTPVVPNDLNAPVYSNDTPIPGSSNDTIAPVASKKDPSPKVPLNTYMDLDTLENNLEVLERRKRMKRKNLKNSKQPITDDEPKPDQTKTNEPSKSSPKKRTRSTKNNNSQKKNDKNSKKPRLGTSSALNQENTPVPPPLEDKMVVDDSSSQPLKTINFQNLKQQTLFAYFKKVIK